VLTPKRAIEHENNHVQNLLVVGAPTSETDMRRRSDRYAAFVACTRKPLPRKDPVRKEVSRVDLASLGQLDPPPSVTGTRGDKIRNKGLEEKIRVWG
jgi:hypothetical protein